MKRMGHATRSRWSYRGMAMAVAVPWALAGGAAHAQDMPPLFAADDPIEITLLADFLQLERDRGEDPPERHAQVILTDRDGPVQAFDAQLRTRGNFRRSRANCLFPPLRLNLPRSAVEGSVFDGQDKLKIVGSCRPGRESYSILVLREYLAYRILRLVTDRAFAVRLARITYRDTSGELDTWTDWGFLIEDDDALAARLGGAAFDLEGDENLPARVFDPVSAARVAVFEYLIGNTDWSEVQGHNVQIIESPIGAVAVPFDFDFSGLVDAPYASPDPEIGIRSVRERRYLGWCRPPGVAEAIVAEFRAAREATMALIDAFEPLDEGEREGLRDYLLPFYEQIETDGAARAAFLDLCKRLRD
ncbi:MAG: hypothetical protein HKN71_11430 [Gemmatimonadetes bacterium]|nr:hypothetical protein [Gemmatimonadota bacterium]